MRQPLKGWEPVLPPQSLQPKGDELMNQLSLALVLCAAALVITWMY